MSRSLARSICRLLRVGRCFVYLREGDSELFRCHGGWGDPRMDDRLDRLVAGVPADGFTREILETAAPVSIADATKDPRPVRSAMQAWEVRSMLGVPISFASGIVGIFFVDDPGRSRTFSATEVASAVTFADLAGVAIAQAQLTAATHVSLRDAKRQNDVMRRALAFDDRIATLMAGGLPLGALVQTTSEFTNLPVAIYDAAGARCALACVSGGDAASRSLDAALLDVPVMRGGLSAVRGERPVVLGPFIEDGLPHRYVVAPITVDDDRWGYVVVAEDGRRLGSIDLHVARRAAICAGIELSAERRAVALEWDARGALVLDLIQGDRDAEHLQRRAEFYGVDLGAPHALCLFAAARRDGRRPSLADVRAAIDGAVSDGPVLLAADGDEVVALVPLAVSGSVVTAVADLKPRIDEAIAQLPDADNCVALSSACERIDGYPRAFGEARQTLDCLRTFAPHQEIRILSADDLGAGRVFLASIDRAEADRFARHNLGPLVDDDPAMRDLLITLVVFFELCRSVRGSAIALGIHENTIRYRLARIERLTGLAVANSSRDQLTAQLSLLVLQLQGECPWDSASVLGEAPLLQVVGEAA